MSAKGLHHSLCQDAPDSAVEPGAWPWLVEKSSAGEAKGQRQAYQAASMHAMTFSVPDPEAQKGWIEEARHQFPAGLHQPEGSFRFSMDALLLARFGLECLAGLQKHGHVLRFADLGAGCGVVGLALLLWSKAPLHGVGIEREACLAEAARINARRLGLEANYAVACGDVAETARHSGLCRRMRLVLANPPWLLSGRCRVSPSALRRAALIGDESTLPRFMEAAATLLEENGRLALVTAMERYDDTLAALHGAGLFPYRLCRIATRAGAPARRLLLEGGRHPGVLHEETRLVQGRALA